MHVLIDYGEHPQEYLDNYFINDMDIFGLSLINLDDRRSTSSYYTYVEAICHLEK